MLVAEIDVWRSSPDAESFPYDTVMSTYLNVGKHFVPKQVLESLMRARASVAAAFGSAQERTLLSTFLDVALDKSDGTYEYGSYIGLPLLPMPCAARQTGARACDERDLLLVRLMSDLFQFESDAQGGSTELLPQLRPDSGTVSKRFHLGLRVVRPVLDRLGFTPISTEQSDQQLAADISAFVQQSVSLTMRRRLQLSMMPVYTAHDEYLFIRVLQMFEVTFAALAVQLTSTIELIGEGDIDGAVSCLSAASSLLEESVPLFSLLATMQVESFRTFRDFTEGASAIQSRAYKMVESLCRNPDPDRLHSTAYESVPEVRDAVIAGRLTVEDAIARNGESGALSSSDLYRLCDAAAAFGESVMRWKRVHFSIAVRMLGQSSGTGATEGTPYLERVRSVPVFTQTAPQCAVRF